MNTLRKKLTAIGLAGSVGVALLALPTVPASAAPVAPSQNIVKQSAPQQTEDVRWRRTPLDRSGDRAWRDWRCLGCGPVLLPPASLWVLR